MDDAPGLQIAFHKGLNAINFIEYLTFNFDDTDGGLKPAFIEDLDENLILSGPPYDYPRKLE